MTVDDSALLTHSRVYDPVKARQYYLRTRQLKGRQAGAVQLPGHHPSARQQEIAAQRAALEKRLNRLKSVLAEKVAAAKGRSGVTLPPDPRQTSTEQAKEKSAQNEASKADTPLTAQQKREKAAQAKEAYQKAHPSPQQELVQLQRQIVDIRAQIKAAVEVARTQADQSTHQTASKGR